VAKRFSAVRCLMMWRRASARSDRAESLRSAAAANSIEMSTTIFGEDQAGEIAHGLDDVRAESQCSLDS